MNISVTDAQNLFTKEIVAKYFDHVKPMAFGRSFFKQVETGAKLVSILVERGNSYVAKDGARGFRGNLNVFDRSTEKITLPPYYNEYFNITDLELYDALYNEPSISAANFGRFLDSADAKMNVCMDNIDRAYELQCWQAFLTGIVTLNDGSNIDYARKAGSLINVAGGSYWTVNGVDPDVVLLQGATFLKEIGKAQGPIIDVIMGDSAFTAYKNNSVVKARSLQVQWGQELIQPAQKNALGQTFHGTTSVGAFNFRIWSYNDTYTDKVTGLEVKYLDSNKIIMLPENTANVLTYAAVPQLLTNGQTPQKGKFLVWDYIDKRNTVHEMGVKSAGIATLAGVDKVFTARVVA